MLLRYYWGTSKIVVLSFFFFLPFPCFSLQVADRCPYCNNSFDTSQFENDLDEYQIESMESIVSSLSCKHIEQGRKILGRQSSFQLYWRQLDIHYAVLCMHHQRLILLVSSMRQRIWTCHMTNTNSSVRKLLFLKGLVIWELTLDTCQLKKPNWFSKGSSYELQDGNTSSIGQSKCFSIINNYTKPSKKTKRNLFLDIFKDISSKPHSSWRITYYIFTHEFRILL